MPTYPQESATPHALVGIEFAKMEARAEGFRDRLLATAGQLRFGFVGETEILEARRTTLLGALAQCEATIAALEYPAERASEERFRRAQASLDLSLPQQARLLKGDVAMLPVPTDVVSIAAD